MLDKHYSPVKYTLSTYSCSERFKSLEEFFGVKQQFTCGTLETSWLGLIVKLEKHAIHKAYILLLQVSHDKILRP